MARQGRPNIRCHSEERSDEESREQDSQRNHTGSFAGAQNDSMFWDYSPIRNCCHSEERSDEESREQNTEATEYGILRSHLAANAVSGPVSRQPGLDVVGSGRGAVTEGL